ncbi:MAG TPA: hypothetical protein VIN10_08525 [Bacteroidales bacterium]
MKTSIQLISATILMMLVISCSNKSNDLTPSNSSENLTQNAWKVSYYEERGKDETSKFSGYQISFENGGVFKLSNSTETFTGSWSIGNKSDDSSSSSQKLIIYISGNYVADELQDDWVIAEQSENQMTLQDDSSDHSETLKLVKL